MGLGIRDGGEWGGERAWGQGTGGECPGSVVEVSCICRSSHGCVFHEFARHALLLLMIEFLMLPLLLLLLLLSVPLSLTTAEWVASPWLCSS